MKRNFKHVLLMAVAVLCLFALASCMQTTNNTAHTCTDRNNDGLCDTCSAKVNKQNNTNDDDDEEEIEDMTGVSFSDLTVGYTGKAVTISVEGAPKGADITYTENGKKTENKKTDAGTYKFTATITAEGYNDLELTATLTINPKPITFTWGDNESQSFLANGETPELLYTIDDTAIIGKDKVNVKIDFGKYDFNKEGSATASASIDNKNYVLVAMGGDLKTTVSIKQNVCTVSFDTGYAGKDFDPEAVVGGETVDRPKTFVRNGYNLIGWFNGETEWNFDDPVTSDMTLTAKWEPIQYTINYYLNGGTNSSKNPATFSVESKDVLYAPEKDGAVFLGWFTDDTYQLPAKALGTTTANLNLYAKWSDTDYTEIVGNKTINSSNTAVTLSKTAISGSFIYSFSANITEFPENGAVYLGRGKDTIDGSYVKITSTHVTVVTVTKDGPVEESRVHLRGLFGYLTIEVQVSNGSANIIFRTADGDNSLYDYDWLGKNGEIFFDSENVTLENASLGWYTDAYESLTWIVGDETIGSSEINTFSYQLNANKFGDFLAIGATGLTSSDVLQYFKDACEVTAPKYAIWSFRADTDANYDANVAEFVNYCKSKGIVPVLSTQSSTATVDNTARNEAVKASGERYIDFASMEIYEGVLVNGVYTKDGARALYSRFITDFPEIVAAAATMRNVSADTIVGVDASYMFPENYVAGDDVKYESDGKTVKLKYGQFEEHRKATAAEVRAAGISMNGNAIKDGKYLIFSAKIDGTLREDQTILVGHGYMVSTAKWIEINGKNIHNMGYQSWSTSHINPTTKTAHGLTIKNYITVVITRDTESANKKVTIYTDGGSATFGYDVNGNAGDLFVSAAGVTLTDCKLSWTCKDYAKDVWVFGDSYLSIGDPARWPTYLYNEKLYTTLMVGASGMSAEEGLRNLEDAIQYGKPKYIVWLEGMNNGEKNGARNAGYHNSIKRLFEICEEYDIIPYIATIPNCPAAKHELKNNAIYNGLEEFAGKEYRIIDWARAVEDFSSDTLWYDGMINENDLIHPAKSGARALYMQLLVDCPEIIYGHEVEVFTANSATLNSGASVTVSLPEKVEKNEVYVFTADFDDELSGTIEIGNGKSVEGGTWVAIDASKIIVYKNVGGVATEVMTANNPILTRHFINLRIHVKGDSANIAFVSTGEPETGDNNTLFSIDTAWSNAGDVFASAQGFRANDVVLKWYSYAD